MMDSMKTFHGKADVKSGYSLDIKDLNLIIINSLKELSRLGGPVSILL